MPLLNRSLPLATLALALLVTGCNVLDSAYDEGGSVDDLLVDANIARQSGDLDHAIELLAQAYEQDPARADVRLDYASTLMQRDELSLVDVEQVADFILEQIGEGGLGARGFATGDSCTFSADHATSSFDPRDVSNYEEIAAASPTLGQIVELLNDPASPDTPPVMPVALQEVDICTVFTDSGLVYDRDAILADLYAAFGNDAEQVHEALWANAVALTLNAYVEIFESEDLPVEWYIVDPEGSSYVGFCVAQEHVAPMKADIQAYLHDIGEATVSLDLLVYDGASATGEFAVYLQEVVDMYDSFEEGLSELCDEG